MRIYGHFHLNAYNPYVTMQALLVHPSHLSPHFLDPCTRHVCSWKLCYLWPFTPLWKSSLPRRKIIMVTNPSRRRRLRD